jgi:hypothetical protein
MDHSTGRERMAFDANPDEEVWASFDTFAFDDLPTRIKFDTTENALWAGTETVRISEGVDFLILTHIYVHIYACMSFIE